MLGKIQEIWKNHGFNIILVLSILFILGYWFFCRRKTEFGTYSKSYYYPLNKSNLKKKKKGPPRESKGETECRKVMQNIFKKSFTNSRPNYLNNDVTGQNLELDVFNSELKLAVEYNGKQHYEYVPFFHATKDAYYNQKYRDKMKRDMCKDLNIKLIEVPYTVKIEDIENYLRKELRK